MSKNDQIRFDRDVDRGLKLAWQIMRCRAAGYYRQGLDEHDEAAHQQYFAYSACAGLLAQALDGNWVGLTQMVSGDAVLPGLPEPGMSWIDHDEYTNIDTTREW